MPIPTKFAVDWIRLDQALRASLRASIDFSISYGLERKYWLLLVQVRPDEFNDSVRIYSRFA